MSSTSLPTFAGDAAGHAREARDAAPVLAHALIAGVLFSFYGVAVCPFVAGLPTLDLVAPVVTVFAAYAALRHPLARALRGARAPGSEESVFALDLGLVLGLGAALAAWNGAVHGFPVSSAAKLLVGFGILGFFIAADLALCDELAASRRMVARGESVAQGPRVRSFIDRACVFGLVSVASLAAVVLLVVRKDLLWLAEHLGAVELAELSRAVMLEVAFVTVAVACYLLRVVFRYAASLRFYVDQQALALRGAAEGAFTRRAPATTNDELGRIAALTNQMIDRLASHTREIEVTQEVTILCLASLAETRDNETGAHLMRTQRYVRTLADALRTHPRFRDTLNERTIDMMYKSAPLHDVGKVGIPDHILLKPGKLNDEEFEVMKTHARLGADALAVAEAHLGASSFMRIAREIAWGHHEKWDGSGYPQGLAGEAIPVSARLMALADVYDALCSERVYKSAYSHEEARRYIVAGRGRHFDPAVVDAFLAEEETFQRIAEDYRD